MQNKMKWKKILCVGMAAGLIAGMLGGCSGGAGDESGFELENDITVVTREEGSGTRDAFIELTGILEKTADGGKIDHTTEEANTIMKTGIMITTVEGDEYAIGYISLGSLDDTVKAVKIDGVEPTAENIKNGTYPIARPFNVAVKKGALSDAAQDFLTFIQSAEGQEVVSNGYIKIDENAPAFVSANPTGKVVVAGSSSVTPVMEKLREAYIAINPSVSVEVHQSDSSAGMTAAMEGTCDIGMASRDLKEKEAAELTAISIAIDGIAVIVNNANSIDNLTMEQIRAIYQGEYTTWSQMAE